MLLVDRLRSSSWYFQHVSHWNYKGLCHFCGCIPSIKVGVICFLRAERERPLYLLCSLSAYTLMLQCLLSLYLCIMVFSFFIDSILLTLVPIAARSCASAGHDECRSIRNHHIVYGYGFGLQVGWPCRCQKRSSSVAWNWRQKKTCHSKLSHHVKPKHYLVGMPTPTRSSVKSKLAALI